MTHGCSTDSRAVTGWITPDGTFHGCPYGGHAAKADALLLREGTLSHNPEREAEKRGWVKLAAPRIYPEPVALHTGDVKWLTPEQVQAVLRWCDMAGVPLPHWWSDKVQEI